MTILRQTPDDYLFHLEAVSPGEARRLWRERIKENWNYECAYCGSTENITLDHVKPRSLGGPDTSQNVLCACESCNHDKGHTEWQEWYQSQYFFSYEREAAIKAWINPIQAPKKSAYQRRNVCYANVA
ncbi:putative endonuclease [Synechococcus phage MA01]